MANIVQKFLQNKMRIFQRGEVLAPKLTESVRHIKGRLSGVRYTRKVQVKSTIMEAQSNVDKTFVKTCCVKFGPALEAIVTNDGEYIERRLKIL